MFRPKEKYLEILFSFLYQIRIFIVLSKTALNAKSIIFIIILKDDLGSTVKYWTWPILGIYSIVCTELRL